MTVLYNNQEEEDERKFDVSLLGFEFSTILKELKTGTNKGHNTLILKNGREVTSRLESIFNEILNPGLLEIEFEHKVLPTTLREYVLSKKEEFKSKKLISKKKDEICSMSNSLEQLSLGKEISHENYANLISLFEDLVEYCKSQSYEPLLF
jgi:hypothetical protein